MDLFCPHCTRRVTVSDDKAGQVLSCPLCAKQFMAPSLAPAPVAPKPPPAPPVPTGEETFALSPAPPPPSSAAPSPVPASNQPAPIPAPPPPPPGDYSRSCSCTLTGEWLAFVPPTCLLLIFVLSFFTWHTISSTSSFSLWGLAFSEGKAVFLIHTLMVLLCLPLSVVVMLFDKGLIPAPPQLGPVLTFKSLLVALPLGLAYLMLCVDYFGAHVGTEPNPIALAMKIAFRLLLVAIIASFLLFWLSWRKKYNLPPPKCDARW